MTDGRSPLRLRLVFETRAAFGPGKADLLAAIGEEGSIGAAGRRFGMSYRRAWELTAELNDAFEGLLVETAAGGKGGGGARLTPLGREILALFRAIEAKALTACAPEIAALEGRLRREGS